jgi:hypothetical protein
VALRFANYRKPFDGTRLSRTEKRQLELLAREAGHDLDGARKDWGSVELVDVVESGRVKYQLYLYPDGNGRLFRDGTTSSEGYIAQHGLEVEDPELGDALRSAFEEFDDFEQKVFFG